MKYSERIPNQYQLLNKQVQLLRGVQKCSRTMLSVVNVPSERAFGCKIPRAFGLFRGNAWGGCVCVFIEDKVYFLYRSTFILKRNYMFTSHRSRHCRGWKGAEVLTTCGPWTCTLAQRAINFSKCTSFLFFGINS